MHDIQLLLDHVAKLGHLANRAKGTLSPTHSITFIGVTIDSSTVRASLSLSRMTDILNILAQFCLGVSLQYGMLLRLIGMLTSATSLIPLRLLHLRPLPV